MRQRPPVAVSLGCHLEGSLQPHADGYDPATLAEGVNYRIGKKIVVDEEFLKGLTGYVLRWIKNRGIQPLSWDVDTTFETWLEKTHYPEWRKKELVKHRDEIDALLKRNAHGELLYFVVKLFMKDEHYIKYNRARGIYARSDSAKIFFGPWFKMIEEEIYQQPEFIKHTRVRDRPSYIYKQLFRDGAKYIATDYSSFEAHFTKEVMLHCEFILYQYMLSTVNGGADVLNIMEEVLTGENRIYNKFMKVLVQAKRMSGEMNTSLGNGFSNLMFMGYVCELLGLECVGVVEGDDGLFVFPGRYPTTEDFAKFGFLIKLEVHDEISSAGFCGNIFDLNDMAILTDPYDVMSQFGWATARYTNSKLSKIKLLLRCKALSLAHQYPGCPILGNLAQYALRVTRSYDIRGFSARRTDISMWERETFNETLDYIGAGATRIKDEDLYVEPGLHSRCLFSELYNIPADTQRYIETQLDSLAVLQPLKISLISDYCPADWQHYYRNYLKSYQGKVPSFDTLPDLERH